MESLPDEYRDAAESAAAAWYREQEAGAERARISWQRARESGYRKVLRRLDDGQFYWHLFRGEERINGGLSPSREDALADAGFAISRHLWLSG